MPRTAWLAALFCLAATACHQNSSTSPTNDNPTTTAQAKNGSLDKLGIEDVVVGKGKEAKAGDSLEVEYTGKLADGTVFDTSHQEGRGPFTFILGQGSVIKGWDQGLAGMKEGGERRLSIPSKLGYGVKNMGSSIPPNSDLYFDVKLDSVMVKSDPNTVIRNVIKEGSGPAIKAGDTAVISYQAKFFNGRPIDSKDKFSFKVGHGDVLGAVDQGIVGMKKGGEVIFQLPAEMSPDPMHQKATNETVYDIKVLDIKH